MPDAEDGSTTAIWRIGLPGCRMSYGNGLVNRGWKRSSVYSIQIGQSGQGTGIASFRISSDFRKRNTPYACRNEKRGQTVVV